MHHSFGGQCILTPRSNNGELAKKGQWLERAAPVPPGHYPPENAEVQLRFRVPPGHTTVTGRAGDPGSVMSRSVHQTIMLALYSVYSIGVWATSWVMHRRGGGSIWTTGKLSHQTLRPLALSGLVSPPIHTWKDLLLTQPRAEVLRNTLPVAGQVKRSEMQCLCYYSLWRNPNTNQIVRENTHCHYSS